MELMAKKPNKISINPIFATVAPIRTYNQDNKSHSATGFFYRNDNNLFFVTNRHVIIDEEHNHCPEDLEFRVHIKNKLITENQWIKFSLYNDDSTPYWRELHPKIDIAAIQIRFKGFPENYEIVPFSRNDFLPDDHELVPGEELLVLGYPLGFHDNVHNLPVIRGATLASAYPVPFKGQAFFLIDSRLHEGTSGSPIVTKPIGFFQKAGGGVIMTTRKFGYLLGIHSHTWPEEDKDSEEEPLQLNAVWFASLIEELTL